jgi:4-deoxy-L-threo-5-hexosulose-uronate ketol-isomerase
MKFNVRYATSPEDSKSYDTEKLRESYLIESVFEADDICLTYSHFDRIIAGGIMPIHEVLSLGAPKEVASDFFLQRRELGLINVGGAGVIHVDGVKYDMAHKDGLYLGRGVKEVTFETVDKANPAKFYMNSSPAHKTYPNKHIPFSITNPRAIGSVETMNKRVIYQYLHPAVLETCQLQMGLTELAEGSGWNTMPCHTHERRMEVYFYFNLKEEHRVFHMMGQPQETRHIVMANEQAVISPSWSIHAGIGTSNYTFIWGMCGENQAYDDMDFVETKNLK